MRVILDKDVTSNPEIHWFYVMWAESRDHLLELIRHRNELMRLARLDGLLVDGDPVLTLVCPHGAKGDFQTLDDIPTESVPSGCEAGDKCWLIYYGNPYPRPDRPESHPATMQELGGSPCQK